jgi:hypothetical protein
MSINRSSSAVLSVALLSLTGLAVAEDAPASKSTLPSLADILDASGLKLTGYVDSTYSYQRNDTDKTSYNTFALQQAAFTLAYQPTSGFGALVNVVAGQNPYLATGFGNPSPGQGSSTTGFYLLQGYAQYVTGSWTLQAGKFLTLAGAEVPSPVNNTNVTRSLLFAAEPVTHTGVRATYAASDQLSLIVGVNNGWTNSQDTADGSDKTLEAGLSFTPSKALAWTLQGYYGRTYSLFATEAGPVKANIALLDTVLTWNATSAFTLVGSLDYGNVSSTSATSSASWWGIAGYANYAINDQWRASLRAEYFDDRDGYLTSAYPAAEKLKEITLTFGYDPSKHFEVRLEGRYDDPDKVDGFQFRPKTYQGWVEAYFKF